jgi:uncharacterized membrane protein
MSVQKYFSEENKLQIINAIHVAENQTSGEIRVHIEKYCEGNVLDRAAYIFDKLEMHKTKTRNGVLFYLALEDRKFAVLGDIAINRVVPENFWEEIKSNLSVKFREGNYAQGIADGVIAAGNQLKEHFPYMSDDVNELSDDISFEE